MAIRREGEAAYDKRASRGRGVEGSRGRGGIKLQGVGVDLVIVCCWAAGLLGCRTAVYHVKPFLSTTR